MVKTSTRKTQIETRLTDGVYARSCFVCRYCGEKMDTMAKAHGKCPVTGKRHFLVPPESIR